MYNENPFDGIPQYVDDYYPDSETVSIASTATQTELDFLNSRQDLIQKLKIIECKCGDYRTKEVLRITYNQLFRAIDKCCSTF